MRHKVRGTLQIQEDVKRLFMLAKPLNVTSSEFLQGLLFLHARKVREQERFKNSVGISISAGPDTPENGQTVSRLTCLGRPPGAKDLHPRKRRTKNELAQAEKL